MPKTQLGVALTCIVIVLAGCGRGENAPAPKGASNPAVPGAVPSDFVAARKTFDLHCAKCHALDAPAAAGPKGMKGPNLAKVGADPKHTKEWIVDYVRDPKSQNPKSRMPKFAGRIADEDVGGLADYLLSLK